MPHSPLLAEIPWRIQSLIDDNPLPTAPHGFTMRAVASPTWVACR